MNPSSEDTLKALLTPRSNEVEVERRLHLLKSRLDSGVDVYLSTYSFSGRSPSPQYASIRLDGPTIEKMLLHSAFVASDSTMNFIEASQHVDHYDTTHDDEVPIERWAVRCDKNGFHLYGHACDEASGDVESHWVDLGMLLVYLSDPDDAKSLEEIVDCGISAWIGGSLFISDTSGYGDFSEFVAAVMALCPELLAKHKEQQMAKVVSSVTHQANVKAASKPSRRRVVV